MLLLLLTLLASTTQSPPPAKPQGIVSADDYPRVAVANGWQGDVGVELTVDRTGRVTACRVTKSSGHQVLDDATCSLLIKRARFDPARDDKGNPVPSHFQTPLIRWRLSP